MAVTNGNIPITDTDYIESPWSIAGQSSGSGSDVEVDYTRRFDLMNEKLDALNTLITNQNSILSQQNDILQTLLTERNELATIRNTIATERNTIATEHNVIHNKIWEEVVKIRECTCEQEQCEQFDLCEVVTAVLERDGFSEFVNTVTP